MQQNWVELVANGDRVVVRPEYIVMLETQAQGYTRILVDSGSLNEEVIVSEPYEQVKQKIVDAERVDYSDVAVEHFTRDEYEKIAAVMRVELKACIEDNADVERTTKIVNKLNEILKEDK